MDSAEDETKPEELIALSPDHVVVEVDKQGDSSAANRILRTERSLLSTSEASQPRGSGKFKISFKYLTSMTVAQQASFEYAAKRLGKIITTKHTVISPPSDLRCGSVPSEPLPSKIEDLFIFVRIKSIDGVSGVLGQAGPCIMDQNRYPRVGYVEFDRADVDKMISDKTFDAVCVHE
jgi:hypothetical protein